MQCRLWLRCVDLLVEVSGRNRVLCAARMKCRFVLDMILINISLILKVSGSLEKHLTFPQL